MPAGLTSSWLLLVVLLMAGCLHGNEGGKKDGESPWKVVAGDCQHLGSFGKHSLYAKVTFNQIPGKTTPDLKGTTVELKRQTGGPADQTKTTDDAGCVGFQVEGSGKYWIGGERYESETDHSCFWYGGNYSNYDGTGAARVNPVLRFACS